MIITDCQYSHGILGFKFDTGAVLFWGPGVLPGTNVPTYRFVFNKGFKDGEYKQAQRIAAIYSRGLGFEDVHSHWESFQTKSSCEGKVKV